MDDEVRKMIQIFGMSEEELTAVAKYAEEISNLAMITIDDLYAAIRKVMNALQGSVSSMEIISLAAYDAAERADYLNKERKSWGHPPRKPYCGYKSPVRAVRPYARSCIRQAGNRRRA